jgi:hypothetical protein
MSGQIGELRPLSHKDLECEELLAILAFSRNSYTGSFFTDSMSDANTTRNFLQDCLRSDTKFLFLIYVYDKASSDSRFYGHLGYEIINDQEIEIINVMKVPNIDSDFKMHQPLGALLSYLETYFPKSQLFLKVLKSNDRAISMYFMCGFKTSTQESTNRVMKMILSRV